MGVGGTQVARAHAFALTDRTVGESSQLWSLASSPRVVGDRDVRPVDSSSHAGGVPSLSGRTTSRLPNQARSECSITVARASVRPASLSLATAPSWWKVPLGHPLHRHVQDAARSGQR
jgi:hypothetical protein